MAAAIQIGEFIASVPAPGRHHNVIYAVSGSGLTPSQVAEGEQGFLTDQGRSLGRMDALAHVQACGQPLLCATPHVLGLFSEDLW